MNREIRYAVTGLRREHLVPLLCWSLPEALPSLLSGYAIARAIDDGFLAHRPDKGMAWLLALVLTAIAGAAGTRAVFRRLGLIVEPVRDDLARRVVVGALRRAVAGRPDDGAVARLTHQVEIVRDTYAGQIMVVRSFAITAAGAAIGLLSLSPRIALLIMPVFLLGLLAFLGTLGRAAARHRDYLRGDEQLSAVAGAVVAGARDVVASGTEDAAATLVGRSIDAQAAAERALARVGVLRSLCFALGGWGPLLVLLAAAPWLIGHGLTAGVIVGGLTYVQAGLQSALGTLVNGLGGSGLRFVITLGRILDADTPVGSAVAVVPADQICLRGVGFRYGPHAEPVLHDLDLTVAEGSHLAVVGPSGVGKSTLAAILCGLLPADGDVRIPVDRVLIPQEAFIFTGSVWDNLTYLRPAATGAEVDAAVAAVGAQILIERLGGYATEVDPAALSAGERQLIALARAYLSPAGLVVLDEATCHLDPAAEARAEAAFGARGGTLIVIAHRISSALRARQILVLDGRKPCLGTHQELLERSDLYRELLGHWSDSIQPAV